MKIHYDMMIPFMPEGKVVDSKVVKDDKMMASRNAMLLLDEFQTVRSIGILYEIVRQISIYAGVNIVDLILSLEDVDIKETNMDNLISELDVLAKNLFLTNLPNYNPDTFDYKYYCAVLLTIAHNAIIASRSREQSSKSAPDNNA